MNANDLFGIVFRKFFREKNENEYDILNKVVKLKRKIVKRVFRSTSNLLDFGKEYLSPWKIMEGYLEGILHIGIVYEVIGDRDQTLHYFKMGRKLSYSLHLPMFATTFSLLLGMVIISLLVDK